MTMTATPEEQVQASRARGVTAVLGPTNTGKTHLAIERMLGHESGLIGLPLRLLAREVYDRIVKRVGAEKVALITGEEKIKPENPVYWVSTVEAMPRDVSVDFLAVDEIQLAADAERGHIFTDRLLHARGNSETLLLGAATMRDTIKDLLQGANFISRPRLSKLTYAGPKKLSRLPRRTAIVAFSAAEVYEAAELVRRQHGGAAVVLGAQSPRTRNAQVAMYQNGDVDYLVATDAIGMGLNLDVDHVAFAGIRKFDGRVNRRLNAAEIAQIAGRAGRYMNDGTFGVTGDAEAFEPELIEHLEKHEFDPIKVLQWRSTNLDYSRLDRLRDSLRTVPGNPRLMRARMADDVVALENLSIDRDIIAIATEDASIKKLWDVCQVPDYRKVSSQAHTELIGTLYKFMMGPAGRIPESFLAEQVEKAGRTDGDIDTLAGRIAHVRTWTFVSHHADWLENAAHWQVRTREIEDTLSDAMHERLAQRFVDQRTATLVKRLRDEDELSAEIGSDGAIKVEQHFVGKLVGFTFSPDASGDGINEKAARQAAMQVVSKELAMRARKVGVAQSDAFKLTRAGRVTWRGEEIAKLEKSDDPLKPVVALLADESLSAADRESIQARLDKWLTTEVAERLKPLAELSKAEDVTGIAKGIAFRLCENFGILKRETIANEIKELDQDSRAQLRKYGLRFGAFNLYFPLLLKPVSAEWALILWWLWQGPKAGLAGNELPAPPRPGLTSLSIDAALPEAFYRASGYHPCGPRAIRVDMLERLADMIRPLVAFRVSEANPVSPPKGSSGDGGFIVVPEMMSILGCGQGEMAEILKALGFRSEKKPKPKPGVVKAAEVPLGEAVVLPDAPVAAEPAETPVAAEAAETPVIAEAVQDIVVVEPAAPVIEAGQAPVAAVEPEMIDVWRPKRFRDQGSNDRRPRPDRNFRRPARDGAVAAEGTPVAAGEAKPAEPREDGKPKRDRGPRRRGRNRDGENRPSPAAGVALLPGEVAAAPAADAKPVEPPRQQPRRDDRRDGGGRDRQRGGGGDGARRDDRQREDRQRDNRAFVKSSGPPPASGGDRKRVAYDPNSPFAGLMKLKSDLEEQQKKAKRPADS